MINIIRFDDIAFNEWVERITLNYKPDDLVDLIYTDNVFDYLKSINIELNDMEYSYLLNKIINKCLPYENYRIPLYNEEVDNFARQIRGEGEETMSG